MSMVRCLPILLSIPHAGTRSASAVAGKHQLTHAKIIADGDVFRRESTMPELVEVIDSAKIARTWVDLNRANTELPR